MKKSIIITLILIGLLNLPQPVGAQKAPFNRGINLTGWFQTGSVRQIQFNRYTRKDLADIKSLGCDVIRLPVNLHFMTSGLPDYQIDPLFYSFLDQVVSWAEELELFLILDNHTFDPAANTDPGIGLILEKVWRQMANHYKQRSQYILYEILNEPHGIADATWNVIQLNVINAIRAVDTRHTIIVGASNFNSYNNLTNLPRYTDPNLLYTFHFYDPFVFTHQGATWVDPSMAPLSGIPFPYNADSMPVLPASLSATWVGDNFRSYRNDGNVQHVKSLIDIAVRFRTERDVPVFCGEFGVYIPNSKDHHRVYWYEEVRKYLEEKQIGWTSWDYHGGFGLFRAGTNGLFEHDLNTKLLQALGLNVPVQTVYRLVPDSAGSMIYSDWPGEHLYESSYSDGIIDYYSEDKPNNGDYCLKWTGAGQYRTIGLDFAPDRDLSELVKKNYALDLMLRGDTPGLSIQIRLIDTKTENTTDYPWRMGIKIDDRMATADRQWHHLYLPFSAFTEGGSWYNGWHDPQGKFDWKAIDRIEIVSEYAPLGNARFWFDNIHFTDRDTAVINETGVFTDIHTFPEMATACQIVLYPNPVNGPLTIESNSTDPVKYELVDFQGRVLIRSNFTGRTLLDLTYLADGLYLIRFSDTEQSSTTRRITKISS